MSISYVIHRLKILVVESSDNLVLGAVLFLESAVFLLDLLGVFVFPIAIVKKARSVDVLQVLMYPSFEFLVRLVKNCFELSFNVAYFCQLFIDLALRLLVDVLELGENYLFGTRNIAFMVLLFAQHITKLARAYFVLFIQSGFHGVGDLGVGFGYYSPLLGSIAGNKFSDLFLRLSFGFTSLVKTRFT